MRTLPLVLSQHCPRQFPVFFHLEQFQTQIERLWQHFLWEAEQQHRRAQVSQSSNLRLTCGLV